MTEEITALIPVEKQNKIEKALEFFSSLREIKINSQSEYDNAVELCKKIKIENNALESDRKELVKPYKDKSSLIDKEYKAVRDKLENAERVIKNGMGTFFRIQEQKRLEDQRKLEAEAEAKRKAAEEKAAAERRKAEEYARQGREDMAAKAEARAATAEDVACNTVADVVENVAKTSGVSYRKVYKVSVINHGRAVAAMVANPVFHPYLVIDLPGFEKLVKASNGMLPTPDGLLVTETSSAIVRA
jgi:membrane protein involved in colicin uptake